MKEQILKFCKRLKKFTLEEITTLSEIDEEDLKLILEELIEEEKLIKNNGIYEYKTKPKSKTVPSIFLFHNKNTIDLVIRCFCSQIPSQKACNIVNLGEDSLLKFYSIFRDTISKTRKDRLLNYFSNKPKSPRIRKFFDKDFYFYIYEKEVFVSEIILNTNANIPPKKDEILEFKKVYSYLTRCMNHNKNKFNAVLKLNEYIWRRNKDFDELYEELKFYLNFNF